LIPVCVGDGLAPLPDVPNAYLLGEGFASYELAGRRLRIGPGFRRHTWTQLRGAEPPLQGVTLYLTDFTPLHKTLRLRLHAGRRTSSLK